MDELGSEDLDTRPNTYNRRQVMRYAATTGVAGLITGSTFGYLISDEGSSDPEKIGLGQTVTYDDHEVSFNDITRGGADIEVARDDSSESLNISDRGIYTLDLGSRDEGYNKIFEAHRVFFSPDGEDGEIVFEIDDML